MTDINVGAGLLSPTGYNPSIQANTTFGATAGAVVIASYAANVQSAIIQNTTPNLAISGYAAAVSSDTTFTVGAAGAVTIASFAASVASETTFTVGNAGSLTIAGFNALAVQAGVEVGRIQGGAASVAIQGYNPAVSVAKQPGYLTLYMGVCDENGENKQFVRRWVNPSGQVFFSLDTADIASPLSSSSVYCYVDVATDGWWYLDDAQLEFDTQDDTPALMNRGSWPAGWAQELGPRE